MSNLFNNFNAEDVDPNPVFDVLPAGEYRAMVTQWEEKETKAGTGSYLQLTLEVQDGEHQGRLIFDRLNLNNPNEQAVQIAQRQLSALCHATGIMRPKSAEDFKHIPVVVKLSVRPPKNGYEASNDVKGYLKDESTNPVRATQRAVAPAQRQAPAPKPKAAPPARTAPPAPRSSAPAPSADAPPWGNGAAA